MSIGPDSVGYQLSTHSKVFGGDVLTTSCIAVATEMAAMGFRDKVKDLPGKLITASVNEIHRMVEDLIDLVKVNK